MNIPDQEILSQHQSRNAAQNDLLISQNITFRQTEKVHNYGNVGGKTVRVKMGNTALSANTSLNRLTKPKKPGNTHWTSSLKPMRNDSQAKSPRVKTKLHKSRGSLNLDVVNIPNHKIEHAVLEKQDFTSRKPNQVHDDSSITITNYVRVSNNPPDGSIKLNKSSIFGGKQEEPSKMIDKNSVKYVYKKLRKSQESKKMFYERLKNPFLNMTQYLHKSKQSTPRSSHQVHDSQVVEMSSQPYTQLREDESLKILGQKPYSPKQRHYLSPRIVEINEGEPPLEFIPKLLRDREEQQIKEQIDSQIQSSQEVLSCIFQGATMSTKYKNTVSDVQSDRHSHIRPAHTAHARFRSSGKDLNDSKIYLQDPHNIASHPFQAHKESQDMSKSSVEEGSIMQSQKRPSIIYGKNFQKAFPMNLVKPPPDDFANPLDSVQDQNIVTEDVSALRQERSQDPNFQILGIEQGEPILKQSHPNWEHKSSGFQAQLSQIGSVTNSMCSDGAGMARTQAYDVDGSHGKNPLKENQSGQYLLSTGIPNNLNSSTFFTRLHQMQESQSFRKNKHHRKSSMQIRNQNKILSEPSSPKTKVDPNTLHWIQSPIDNRAQKLQNRKKALHQLKLLYHNQAKQRTSDLSTRQASRPVLSPTSDEERQVMKDIQKQLLSQSQADLSFNDSSFLNQTTGISCQNIARNSLKTQDGKRDRKSPFFRTHKFMFSPRSGVNLWVSSYECKKAPQIKDHRLKREQNSMLSLLQDEVKHTSAQGQLNTTQMHYPTQNLLLGEDPSSPMIQIPAAMQVRKPKRNGINIRLSTAGQATRKKIQPPARVVPRLEGLKIKRKRIDVKSFDDKETKRDDQELESLIHQLRLLAHEHPEETQKARLEEVQKRKQIKKHRRQQKKKIKNIQQEAHKLDKKYKSKIDQLFQF